MLQHVRMDLVLTSFYSCDGKIKQHRVMVSTVPMPSLFISHGTPLQAIWNNEFTRTWAGLGRTIPRPELILSISAHWLTRGGVYLTGNEQPPVIYDMGGFPDELYQVEYPAHGAPEWAREIASLIDTTPAFLNSDWGLDHGTWVVLKHMFPEADIPVVQLSVNYAMPEADHFRLGRELASLRSRGVLIMGTGQFVHNLRQMGRREGEQPPFPWATEFSETVGRWVDDRDFERVIRFRELGELARIAHPAYDHFLPLLTVLGTVGDQDELTWLNNSIVSGSIDMRSLLVQARTHQQEYEQEKS